MYTTYNIQYGKIYTKFTAGVDSRSILIVESIAPWTEVADGSEVM